MARRIKLTQVKDFYKELIVDAVAVTTLEWTRRVKKATPVDTGRLRAAWQTDIKPLEGTVSNNVVYSEPVCFGTSCHHHGEVSIEQNKKLWQVFQH